jgi:hypothetical protein
MPKIRRIIDEWGTVVKRKISLSFKEIIDIIRSIEGSRRRRRTGRIAIWIAAHLEGNRLSTAKPMSMQPQWWGGRRVKGDLAATWKV